jgi:hypothetical protein
MVQHQTKTVSTSLLQTLLQTSHFNVGIQYENPLLSLASDTVIVPHHGQLGSILLPARVYRFLPSSAIVGLL